MYASFCHPWSVLALCSLFIVSSHTARSPMHLIIYHMPQVQCNAIIFVLNDYLSDYKLIFSSSSLDHALFWYTNLTFLIKCMKIWQAILTQTCTYRHIICLLMYRGCKCCETQAQFTIQNSSLLLQRNHLMMEYIPILAFGYFSILLFHQVEPKCYILACETPLSHISILNHHTFSIYIIVLLQIYERTLSIDAYVLHKRHYVAFTVNDIYRIVMEMYNTR